MGFIQLIKRKLFGEKETIYDDWTDYQSEFAIKESKEVTEFPVEVEDHTPKPKFLIKRFGKKWYFHLKSTNGKFVTSSKMFTRKNTAIEGAKALKRNAARAEIEVVE